ncbi:MAG: hypothetical protein JF611_11525, partial [Betaproteobacteria bacterium]|nr:hypothetical protein [Betaproteobacteria bacterium]
QLGEHCLGIGTQALAGFGRDEIEYPIYGAPQIHASFLPSSCMYFFLWMRRADSGINRRAALSCAA